PRLRVNRLVPWLSQRETAPCLSVIVPTAAAQQKVVPTLSAYPGLHAIIDLRAPSDNREWHFLWTSVRAADRFESRIAQDFGSGSATRHRISWIDVAPEHTWKRVFSVGVIATLITSLAAILTHLDEINSSIVSMTHRPKM